MERYRGVLAAQSAIGAIRGLNPEFSLREIVDRTSPGCSTDLQTFLHRPPKSQARGRPGAEKALALVRKMLTLVSVKGEDLSLQTSSEDLARYHRLRASVPARLWKWKTVASWRWTGSKEHINSLELGAVLTSLRWRLERHKKDFMGCCTGELLAVKARHVTISKAKGPAVISLGLTKAGKRQGAIHSEDVCRRLHQWKLTASPDKLLAGSPHSWRKRLSEILTAVHLDQSDFRPYSLRRGGATYYFQVHGRFDSLLVLGRWQVAATARLYINEGLSALAEISLPRGTYGTQRQAWHLATWTFTLCGRRGTYGTQLGLVTRLVGKLRRCKSVAGVALGDMDFHSVWQAWHLGTWTFTLCGRRATCGTQLGLVTRLVAFDAATFCVADVTLGDMDLHFVWQAWHLGTWTFTLFGRRDTSLLIFCASL
eukprot:s849_g14.t1